ncbi:MAG: hypothetical protein PHC66_02405 [Candidatus Nanoarchaeia archaeon]|nr:hypothetical protein [Candidatus Nanoarchaeia archaeon]MDD5239494.1 hypothetical protein [Candidatus Nanoarchaeia archaeon]
MEFQRKYNELKIKSYDIAVRLSDLELTLGYDNASINKIKKLFSKLQSSVNFAFYYKQHRMDKESKLHMDYAFKIVDYIYSAFENIEAPKSEVEIRMDKKISRFNEKPKTKGFRLRLGWKQLLLLFAAGIAYCAFMYFFFIKGKL